MNTARNKWFTAGVLLLVAANIALLALLFLRPSQPPFPPGGGPHPHEYLENELALDANQKQQYREMREAQRRHVDSLDHEMHRLREQLFAFSKNNDASADSLGRRIGLLHGQIEQSTYGLFSRLRAICRPDQQKKFDAVIGEMLRRLARRPPGGHPPR